MVFNFTGVTTTLVSVMCTHQAASPSCVEVEICVYNSDINSSFEAINFFIEGIGFGNIVGGPPAPQCGADPFCRTFTMPGSAYNTAILDNNLQVFTNGNANTDNICGAGGGFDVEIRVPVATAIAANDFNGGLDASGFYPVGTTTVTWTNYDPNTCLEESCSIQVIVNDIEPPVFLNCPGDITISLDPGECTKIWEYPDIVAEDQCPVTTATSFTPAGTAQGCVTFQQHTDGSV